MENLDSLGIVVSAPAIRQATFQQAELAQILVHAKITHEMEVVSPTRAREAQRKLNLGMRVFFHQGGAPSKWSQQFPRAGCLIALGYYAAIRPIGFGDPPPEVPLALWTTETNIFRPPEWEFTHFIRYQNVRHIIDTILTKETIGRWPRPGENFIVIGSKDKGYGELNNIWRNIT